MINTDDKEALREVLQDSIKPIIDQQREHGQRISALEIHMDRLKVSVNGDPTVRSGPPSLFETVAQMGTRIMNRIDESDKALTDQIKVLGGVVKKHEDFIQARMRVEKSIFRLAQGLFKLVGRIGTHTILKTLTAAVVGSLIGIIISALSGLL